MTTAPEQVERITERIWGEIRQLARQYESLREGAEASDAVETDPALLDIERRVHQLRRRIECVRQPPVPARLRNERASGGDRAARRIATSRGA